MINSYHNSPSTIWTKGKSETERENKRKRGDPKRQMKPKAEDSKLY